MCRRLVIKLAWDYLIPECVPRLSASTASRRQIERTNDDSLQISEAERARSMWSIKPEVSARRHSATVRRMCRVSR